MGKYDRNIWKKYKTTGTYEEIDTTGSYGKNTTGPYEKNRETTGTYEKIEPTGSYGKKDDRNRWKNNKNGDRNI
jgi:hypothetical protein